MTLRFGSVCSGIEAALVAWAPLGWRASFFSEIDAFPRAVLAHHHPAVPCHGDFTTIEAGLYDAIDLLVGGTPCQSFSVAGLRGGLADERGNLALEFCRLARRLGPRWVVWENVPGVLSLDGGEAFGSILGGLAECGYGLAYRVLDAQYVRVDGFARAVPQRRRRVFVVGCLGGWQRAAAVLFERASLRGDPAPRREAGQIAARSLTSSLGKRGGVPDADNACDGGLIAQTLNAGGHSRNPLDEPLVPAFDQWIERSRDYGGTREEWERLVDDGGTPLVPVGVALRGRDQGATAELTGDVMTALRTDKPHVLLPFDETQITSAENRCNPQPGDPCHPLAKGARPPTLAFRTTGNDGCYETGQITDALTTGTDRSAISLLTGWRVRRLMPVECERLQGFPDGYTAIPYRGGVAADGPRYKALGNSMAVNVMRWIGRRIEMVEAIGRRAA